jgi:hypothetical protein
VPWREEIAGLSLHVWSCPGSQTRAAAALVGDEAGFEDASLASVRAAVEQPTRPDVNVATMIIRTIHVGFCMRISFGASFGLHAICWRGLARTARVRTRTPDGREQFPTAQGARSPMSSCFSERTPTQHSGSLDAHVHRAALDIREMLQGAIVVDDFLGGAP